MDEFACQGHRSRSRVQEVYDFLLGVAGSGIPSPSASFSIRFFKIIPDHFVQKNRHQVQNNDNCDVRSLILTNGELMMAV